MQTGDRNTLNRLHSHSSGASLPPKDLRDASRPNKSNVPIWTKKPFTIQLGQDRLDDRTGSTPSANLSKRIPPRAIPSTVALQKARIPSGSNPFSGSRLQTTLNNQNKTPVGNVVAKQTVFPAEHAPSRPLKRPRTDSTSYHDFTSRSTRKMTHASTSASVDVIDLDADEDLGQCVTRPPSSPDPLNSINGASYGGTRRHHENFPELPADGPSTRRLQKKLTSDETGRDSDVESIEPAEDFDDETLSSKVTPKQNFVREKIDHFNKELNHKTPTLDLRTKLVREMKGKQPMITNSHTHTRSKQKDPVATSATKFFGKSNTMTLPIEWWYLGSRRLPEGDGVDRRQSYILFVENGKLTIKNNASGIAYHFLTATVDRDLIAFEYSRDVSNCTVWKFKTADTLAGPKKHNKASDKSFDRCFKPGSSGADGMITIKFDNSNEKRFKPDYQTLTAMVCRMIKENSAVNDAGAVTVWETAIRGLEFDVWSSSRKTRGQTPSRTLTKKPNVARRSSSPPEAVIELKSRSSIVRTTIQNEVPSASKASDVVPSGTTRQRPRPKPIQQVAENATAGPSMKPRRSARHHTPEDVQPLPLVDPDELILVYPPDGPGAVNISNADLSRLRPGEFLNDTLIEFGLKLLLNELRAKDPEFAESIHVFSSFFYKKLNKKNLEEGYQSIRKWTLKVDLFKKKYIVVPINENLHWYLAIIYRPEYFLLPPPVKSPTRGRAARTSQEISECRKNLSSPSRLSRPASPSETQGEAEVEAILHFRSSCSISPPEDDARTISGSSTGVEVGMDDLAPGQKPIPVEDVSDSRALSPLSDITDGMDVDQPIPHGDRSCSPSVARSELAFLTDGTISRRRELRNMPSDAKPLGQGADYLKDRGHRENPLDLGDEDIVMKDSSSPLPTPVDPVSFYGPGPTRHSFGKVSGAFPPKANVKQDKVEKPVDDRTADHEEPQTTYIFTLDSLGSQHRQAINTLRHYLMMEAKDKRDVTETTPISGKHASVPVQPNHCDCGIYLLHFARTFMTDPVRYCQTILSSKSSKDRRADWKHEDIGGMREQLTARILELSEQWKVHRAAKEEQRKKEICERKEAEEVESSDSEIDIVEDVHETVKNVAKPPQKPKSKAARVR